jgi:hypothetical protein
MSKKELHLIVLLILVSFLGFIFQKFIERNRKISDPDCLQIKSQQNKVSTEEEFKNKISFHVTVINLCETEKEVNQFRIITRSKSGEEVINTERFIDQRSVIAPKSSKDFQFVLHVDDKEFAEFYKYRLDLK